jgi:tRNA-Thr(GGU) m(6)t(6)A37 methyltransferase TsaA
MDDITYRPIGIIRTPYKKLEGMPIQPSGAEGIRGTIQIEKEYLEGLKDLDGFSHVILIYHFHLSKGYALTVTPFLDDQQRGLFATRAPRRPNSIGLSVVKLTAVKRDGLEIENVDIVDGTPLLDIKPYIPVIDAQAEIKTGWFGRAEKRIKETRSDDRFVSE